MRTDAHNFLIKGITLVGHKLVDSITSDKNWNEVKDYSKENSLPLTISMISRLASELF
ncbi:hypothetical protein DSM07_10375 [Oenococcus sp. UCMA 16435]|uniref:hypothetical protein n=1 Tax=Oenococcus oeni TaxID=1247 RepID=UPI000A51E2EC|nr:hypothetical protein [Oenococcus oeni]MDI4584356.1 hypothetical protein [Oenococcus sp. UCMA 14587]QHW12472.1 hypothetical protein DSM07_10375 [Oenococcus sp. UCMA 16435]